MMNVRSFILAANQQRRRAWSQMVSINASVRQHFSPLNVLSDPGSPVQVPASPCGDPTPRHASVVINSYIVKLMLPQ